MACGLKQDLEIYIIKGIFEYPIWWSELTNWYKACPQKYIHEYEYVIHI
jgi:hypothetical protein